MDTHPLLSHPDTRPNNQETHWPQLALAIASGDLPPTGDIATPLVDLRNTVTRVINNLIVGIEPSTSDWRELTDELAVAHLLWSTANRGTRAQP